MVAQNRIRCMVVAVPVSSDRVSTSGALGRDVLPWADPYVAGLIKKLQDEVRHERRYQALVRHYSPSIAEQSETEFTARGAVLAEPWDDASEDDMLFAQ